MTDDPMTDAATTEKDGPTSDIARMSYEEARDALVETVARLESGQADLETSVALWERGEALAAHCTAALDRAEARLDRPGPSADGDRRADAPDDAHSSLTQSNFPPG